MNSRREATRLGQLLKAQGHSLQANAKMIEGNQSPDRNTQFEHINATVAAVLAANQPVISVDTKKKELVGAYRNAEQEWLPSGNPGLGVEVLVAQACAAL